MSLRYVIGIVLLCSSVLAQTAATNSRSNARSTETRRSVKALTVDDVIQLLQAGIGEQTIILKLQKAKQTFDLQPSEMLALKRAGASSTLLQIMLDPSAEVKPPGEPSVVPTSLPPATTGPSSAEAKTETAAKTPAPIPENARDGVYLVDS